MAFKDSVFRAYISTKEWAKYTAVRAARSAIISVVSMIPVLVTGNITIQYIGVATLCSVVATIILCAGGIPEVTSVPPTSTKTEPPDSINIDTDKVVDNVTKLTESITTLVKAVKSDQIDIFEEDTEDEDDMENDEDDEDDN